MSRRLQNGEMIGDYRIVGFLGAGGMGSVYHGVHTKIDRPAAIKVLSNPADGSTFKERFFNEARVQSSLQHANIATLYDFQVSANGDDLFIVMEFVDGETLDAFIGRRHFAVEDALVTFRSICEAAKFMHENNVVHRDIKPQNIKISSKGVVKMLDFGIAKDAVSDGLTRVGGIVGTPNYLAPEQLIGHPASPQTDVWALGILFYEMLTGAAPFPGATLAELHGQISAARFEAPQKLNSAVSNEVKLIIDRSICADVRQRYQSVEAMLRDIETALRRREHPSAGTDPDRTGGFKQRSIATGFMNSDHQNGSPVLKIALIGSGVAVVLALVVFGLWAMSGVGPASAGVNITPTPRVMANRGNNSANQSGRATTQAAPKIDASSSRPKARIELTEGTATVFRDGQLLGTTPVEIEGGENELVKLTLKRDGYQDLNESIEITTRRKVFTFTLRKNK